MIEGVREPRDRGRPDRRRSASTRASATCTGRPSPTASSATRSSRAWGDERPDAIVGVSSHRSDRTRGRARRTPRGERTPRLPSQRTMSVDSPEELAPCAPPARSSRRRSARCAAPCAPGITTAELDAIARARVRARRRALRAAAGLRLSRHDLHQRQRRGRARHPRPRACLRRGDLVKLDVTAELDGFYADACRTVAVGDGAPAGARARAHRRAGARRRAEGRHGPACRSTRSARPCSASSTRAASRSATGSWATASAGASTRRPTCPTSSTPALSQPLTRGARHHDRAARRGGRAAGAAEPRRLDGAHRRQLAGRRTPSTRSSSASAGRSC